MGRMPEVRTVRYEKQFGYVKENGTLWQTPLRHASFHAFSCWLFFVYICLASCFGQHRDLQVICTSREGSAEECEVRVDLTACLGTMGQVLGCLGILSGSWSWQIIIQIYRIYLVVLVLVGCMWDICGIYRMSCFLVNTSGMPGMEVGETLILQKKWVIVVDSGEWWWM